MAILMRRDCVGCGAPLADWGETRFTCEACTSKLDALRLEDDSFVPSECDTASVFRYDGMVASAIRGYKFHGQRQLAAFFAAEAAHAIQKRQDKWQIDYITFIPIGFRRARERGFNQSKLIAAGAAKKLSIPCKGLLRKRAGVVRQSATEGREQRWQNAAGAFIVTRAAEINGKRLLLIDDVRTTGATLSAAAHALQQAGAESVFKISIAQT